MKTILMFCFGKFYFLLAIGDVLEQNHFWFPDFGLFGRQFYPPDIGQYWNIFTFNVNIHTAKKFTHHIGQVNHV